MTRTRAIRDQIYGRRRQIGLALLLFSLLIWILPATAEAGYYGHHYSYGHHYGGYGHHYGYGGYGGYGYGGYGYGYYGATRHHQTVMAARLAGQSGLGGLDLSIRPKKADVYLDGEYVGKVRDFDGYPSYLWMKEGTHQLVIYRDGYLTVAQEFSIRPGVISKVKFRLQPGASVPAAELAVQPAAAETE